jgi:hypothetical protein
MKCPKCKKEIEEVNVIGECWQVATLEEGTNIIEEYGEVEDILKTIRIECPECQKDITKHVKE